MLITEVVERAERVLTARADTAADRASIEAALRAASQLQSWLASSCATLSARLAQQVSFPEKAIADCTRSSLHDATTTKERSDTLTALPSFADALDAADVTAAHVDAITRAGKPLDDRQRGELFERIVGLVGVASVATVDEFRRRLALEVRSIQNDDGIARLERQRRAARLRTWVDDHGLWRFNGAFDPVTGIKLNARLEAELEALFAAQTPDTSPTDPFEKQAHLRALAFARIVLDSGGAVARPGRPEFVVVVDASHTNGAGGPLVDWGIPVQVPSAVLADMMNETNADVHAVVVRNGIVLHAPGTLDLGRSTRLANRHQRRALRGLYSTCAIPGCAVHYDRCQLHHVVWWRNGGRTDLANLIPICTHHHSNVHDRGWILTLGANRELTIRFPDGTIHNTSPPNRQAA